VDIKPSSPEKPATLPAETKVDDRVAAGMLERAGAQVQIPSSKEEEDKNKCDTRTAELCQQQTSQDLGTKYTHIVEDSMAALQKLLIERSPQLSATEEEALKQQVRSYIHKQVGTCYQHIQTLSKSLTSLLQANGYQETQEIIVALQMSRPIVDTFCAPLIALTQDCIKYNFDESTSEYTKGEIIGGVAGGILGLATFGVLGAFGAYAGSKLGKAIENKTKKDKVNVDRTKQELTSRLNQCISAVVEQLKEYFMLAGSKPDQALANRLQLAVSSENFAAIRECLNLGVASSIIQQTMSHATSETTKKLLQKYM
jgi:hypothetical protein